MKELATALAKAQAQIKGALKDSMNPHFRNRYADLESVWDACREALTSNGLSVVQGAHYVDGQWVLTTQLLHTSGDLMESHVPLLNSKGDMQGLGSAMTYARRYGLAAMVGVVQTDDDGNAASNGPSEPAAPVAKPDGYDDWRTDLEAAADAGKDALVATWKASPEQFRNAMPQHERDALKARAAKATS